MFLAHRAKKRVVTGVSNRFGCYGEAQMFMEGDRNHA